MIGDGTLLGFALVVAATVVLAAVFATGSEDTAPAVAWLAVTAVGATVVAAIALAVR